MQRFRNIILSAIVAVAATATAARTSRSLDDIERPTFNAATSPLQLDGLAMTPLKSGKIKSYKAPRRQSLAGTWQLVSATQPTEADWRQAVQAKVPGSVHMALVEAGVIPDPTIGHNDSIAERQSYRHWWYRRTFDYDGPRNNVMLRFGGVANRCTVYLNGKELGHHEGMLGGPDFALPDSLLRRHGNELAVHLEPIPQTPPSYANTSWVQTVVANCVYGWHYVKIPSLGIWQDVTLEEMPADRIENPYVITRTTDGAMRLTVDLPRQAPDNSKILLRIKPRNFDGKPQAFTADVSRRQGTVALDFNISNPRLWWPNGSGDQNLYTATVVYLPGSGRPDVKDLGFGIRTIEMQPMASGPHEDMYNWKFTVNGRPIFAKGTNWCLMDFMLDLSPERYSRYLEACRDQHLNLLRAWGGGLVETDTFYDMCDSMGLMVMQEWPTAWNSHLHQPLDMLKETVTRNTPRIRTHPSLVMWAGGNESADPFGEAIDFMGRASIELDGTRPFHRGEPWGGSLHNHDSWWLDLHLNNALNMNAVFMGEFGMPSLPVRETVDRYLDGEKFTWPLAENTVFEHHGPVFGQWQDMRRLEREVSFLLEPTSLDNMILGSQLAQTLGTRRALERSRTMWPDSVAGAVYYKINDVFPGLSWGTVDYYGAKKPVYYFVRRSASPCIPVILFDQTNLTGQNVALKYYLLDDTLSLCGQPTQATVEVYNFEMKKVLSRTDTLVPTAGVMPLPDIRLTARQATSPLLLFKTDVRDLDGRLLARNWYIQNFDSRRNAILDMPRCDIGVSQTTDSISITNKSDSIPAIAVGIEVAGHAHMLDLSDNMLWIDPGETVTVSKNIPATATVTAWNAD